MSHSKTTKPLYISKKGVCVGQTPASYCREIKPFITEESCSYSLAKTSQFSDIIWIRTSEINVFICQIKLQGLQLQDTGHNVIWLRLNINLSWVKCLFGAHCWRNSSFYTLFRLTFHRLRVMRLLLGHRARPFGGWFPGRRCSSWWLTLTSI